MVCHRTRGRISKMPKSVTVARLNDDVPTPKAFGDDATVDDVLNAYGVELEKGETLAINGKSINGSHKPLNGDCIYISPSSTGA